MEPTLHGVPWQRRVFIVERLAPPARLCDTCLLCLLKTCNKLHKKLPAF
jgi:hypothetical protein